jgi:peptidoglycan/LPS O-acetylase OafA/YrhL
MPVVAAASAIVCAAVGWYYLFYSRSADRLGALEGDAANRRRRFLRRVNGGTLFLLATAFYAGFFSVDPHRTPRSFVVIWLGVMLLLAVAVVLAGADIRLTAKIRRRKLP